MSEKKYRNEIHRWLEEDYHRLYIEATIQEAVRMEKVRSERLGKMEQQEMVALIPISFKPSQAISITVVCKNRGRSTEHRRSASVQKKADEKMARRLRWWDS